MHKLITEKYSRKYSLPLSNEVDRVKPSTNRHHSEPIIRPLTESDFKRLNDQENKFEKERKRFDIIKQIPVVGLVYRVGRAFKFKMKNDDEEVTHSLTVDLANLNPIKVASGITRAALNLPHNYNDGIWIGKRSLKKCKIGLTIKPITDLWHYAIMIRGIVYHVKVSNYMQKKFVTVEVSDDIDLKK